VMKCEGNQHHAKYIGQSSRRGFPCRGTSACPMRIPQPADSPRKARPRTARELVDDARVRGCGLLFDHDRSRDVGCRSISPRRCRYR
jgi:hypothetical protein